VRAQDLGAQLIDADRIVHELLEPGQQAWQEARNISGTTSLPDGCIDRRKLGEIVFHDEEEDMAQ
jgi:dephospho-CoA kinase